MEMERLRTFVDAGRIGCSSDCVSADLVFVLSSSAIIRVNLRTLFPLFFAPPPVRVSNRQRPESLDADGNFLIVQLSRDRNLAETALL